MTNTTEEKATLRERLAFLEQKNEALQLEVSHLTDQNSKLSDQLEVLFYLKYPFFIISRSRRKSTLN